MFVEQVFWAVPINQQRSCIDILDGLAHSMRTTGGLLRSMVGCETGDPSKLLSLNFWKSWEDLSRFLASNTPLLDDSYHGSLERLHLHHFEIVWECSGDSGSIGYGARHWSIHEFTIDADQVQPLLDALRQCVSGLKHDAALKNAGIWVDKNNEEHVELALQWSREPKIAEIDFSTVFKQAGIIRQQVVSHTYDVEAVNLSVKTR